MQTRSRTSASTTAQVSAEATPAPVPVGPWWRRAISVLLLLHLTAVAVAPFTFASSSPQVRSPVAMHLMQWLRPYIQFAFLDHGYFFFAPNPGPSHLLRVRMKDDDLRKKDRLYPDRHLDFPRLLYHRHFMLAEQLNSMFVPATPPPFPENSPEYRGWQVARKAYEARRESFIEHLQHVYGRTDLDLIRVEHRPLSPEELRRGRKLYDRNLYVDLPEDSEPELIYPE